MRINSMYRFVFALLLSLMMGQVSLAAEMCQYVFQGPEVKTRPVDFGLNRSAKDGKQFTPVELVQYRGIKTDLAAALNKVPANRKAEIEHLLSAVEFFDYTHTADKILPAFLKGESKAFNFTNLYDQAFGGETKGAPFNGFVRARDYLKSERPAVTPELLGELHKRIMADGVENIRMDQLGVLRDGHWMGNAVGNWALTARERAIIEENPYLAFQFKNNESVKLSQGVWSNISIWGTKRDMRLAPASNSLEAGLIHYPFVRTPKIETIKIIESSHPEIYKAIMEYRKANEPSYTERATPEMEQMFTKALVEERFQRFNTDRAALGEVKIGINEHKYIDLVADFQRDLVAIHPVLNGNGRTTRLFMNYLLTKEGLPPVRLVDPFLDVQVSKAEWREYVHKGVVNNAQLYADVLYRLKNDLVVEHSPELIYPGLPEMVSIALKKQGSNKVVENYAQTKVVSEQFNAFIKSMFQTHPELATEVKNDRLRTMSRMADLFVEYYRSKTVRFIHDKDGEREIALRLVEPDFVASFGVNKSSSKAQWQAKMDRWYDTDLLVWRGLSNKTKELTNKELLEYFKTPTTHLVSNRVFGTMRQGKSLLEAIKDDFATYNRETINGDMIEIAIDHHRSGPKYGVSYGYSTSKREVVGKAFAMGAMVVGKYGEHMDPALQAQLKSRINVASYRAMKDVDLGRLKAFDPEFSYTYGRQAEVMGIGGTDPDAVMLLQRLDSAGKVMQTLLRNIEKPNEIIVIEGRYVPTEGPLPTERIIERHLISPTRP